MKKTEKEREGGGRKKHLKLDNICDFEPCIGYFQLPVKDTEKRLNKYKDSSIMHVP